MEVGQRVGQLVDYVLPVGLVQHSVLDGIEQVALQVLEHQVQVDIVLGLDYLLELDYVGVVELFQDADLPVGALRIGVVLEGQEYLFERVQFLCFPLLDLPDIAIGSAADLLDFLVFFFDVLGDTILLVFYSAHFEIMVRYK